MKKIAYITFHRSVNYGSFLQAYATQTVLKGKGYDVKLIDYSPYRYTFRGLINSFAKNNKKLNKLLLWVLKRVMEIQYLFTWNAFNRARKRHLDMTEFTYKSMEDFKNHPVEADVYLSGSDQIWNVVLAEGIDPPFYLAFTDSPNKISNAASFGIRELPLEYKEEVKGLLSKYSAITVREEVGVEICKDLGLEAKLILDPTFLLNKEDWKAFAKPHKKRKPYIVSYILAIKGAKSLYQYAHRLAKKMGCQLIYITRTYLEMFEKGKMKFAISPEEFVGLFANAECVVTDSFHAVSFSINLEKSFYVKYPDRFSSRIDNILNKFSLKDRRIEDDNAEPVFEPIDYSKISPKLNKARNDSLETLISMIETGSFKKDK